jgi:hypothetical protein
MIFQDQEGPYFAHPHGLLFDTHKNILFVADTLNNDIKQIEQDGTVSSLIPINVTTEGIGESTTYQQIQRLHHPMYLAFTQNRELLITDSQNHQIKVLDISTRVMKTLAGSTRGFEDGNALSAKFNNPTGIAISKDGNIYVCDLRNNVIRVISTDGKVSTCRYHRWVNYPDDPALIDRTIYSFKSPWNLVIIDDLLIVSELYNYTLKTFRIDTDKTSLTTRRVSYLSPHDIHDQRSSKALNLSLDGTILATLPDMSAIMRLKVDTPDTISNKSEEESPFISCNKINKH